MSSGQNLNFLLGVLQLAMPDKTSTGYSVVPPFRQSWKGSDPLVLSDPEPASVCHAAAHPHH